MNYKNGSDSYEVVYPNNQVSSIIDLESYLSENYYDKMEVNGNTWSIGDIRPTTLELDDKWLLCDGSGLSSQEYPELYKVREKTFRPYVNYVYIEDTVEWTDTDLQYYYADLENNMEYCYYMNDKKVKYRNIGNKIWQERQVNVDLDNFFISIKGHDKQVCVLGGTGDKHLLFTDDITSKDFIDIRLNGNNWTSEYFNGYWYLSCFGVSDNLKRAQNLYSYNSIFDIPNFGLPVNGILGKTQSRLILLKELNGSNCNFCYIDTDTGSLTNFSNSTTFQFSSSGTYWRQFNFSTYEDNIVVIDENKKIVYYNNFNEVFNVTQEQGSGIVFSGFLTNAIYFTCTTDGGYNFYCYSLDGNILYKIEKMGYIRYNGNYMGDLNKDSQDNKVLISLPNIPNILVDNDDYHYYIKAKN